METISTREDQAGAYLLEVLIAILVLSFGLLAMLGLMLNTMKLSSTATYRSIATQETAHMADTLRANLQGYLLFHSPSDACAEKVSCYKTGGCTPDEIACNEVANWRSRLLAQLPHKATTPKNMICQGTSPPTSDGGTWACSTSSKDPFVIRVCWDDSRGEAAAAATCVYTQL